MRVQAGDLARVGADDGAPLYLRDREGRQDRDSEAPWLVPGEWAVLLEWPPLGSTVRVLTAIGPGWILANNLIIEESVQNAARKGKVTS